MQWFVGSKDKYDAEHTGKISAADANAFAKDMVAAGWKDWAPSERDRRLSALRSWLLTPQPMIAMIPITSWRNEE